jgi:hypothetical protein
MRKRLNPDPDPYLWLMEPDPDPGGPKTCGSRGSGSGSQTLCVEHRWVFKSSGLFPPPMKINLMFGQSRYRRVRWAGKSSSMFMVLRPRYIWEPGFCDNT